MTSLLLNGIGADVYDYHGPYLDLLQEKGDEEEEETASDHHAAAIERAAAAIDEADILLIGAGAGIGVDSGLHTYASVCDMPSWAARGHSYDTLCRPSLLETDPGLFLGFWGHCYNSYSEAAPHEGYRVLKRWCDEKAARAVVSQKEGQEEGGLATPFFVYSSNVDGHFDRAGFDSASSVLELHGDARRWFCPACAAGADVPFSCASQTPMEGFRFSVDEASMTLPGGERDGRRRREEQQEDGGSAFDFGDSSGGWPRCRAPQCPSPALPARPSLLRPAVHMFDERDDALLAHLRSEEERYVAWECEMEKAVRGLNGSGGGKRLVLLEIGCGLRVPSVRMEMEEVYRDLLDALRRSDDEPVNSTANSSSSSSSSSNTDRVTLVRINKEFPQNPLPRQPERRPRSFRTEGGHQSSSSSSSSSSSAAAATTATAAEEDEEGLLRDLWASRSIAVGAGALDALTAIDRAILQRRRRLKAGR